MISYLCSQQPSYKPQVFGMTKRLQHYGSRVSALLLLALLGLTAGFALQASVTATPAHAKDDCNHSFCAVEQDVEYCAFVGGSYCTFDASGNCSDGGCS